ncbi:MAG: hypothetical protein HZC55_03650 [Verrucomicrobia bacterium]|nr:hypothetical protein [Verrucomicrobiota bacterium]
MQWPLLVLFLSFIVVGWGLLPPAGVNDKLYARSNLVTLVVWGIWWPLMVWGAFWLGRAWCLVCPLELVNNLGERAASRTGRSAPSLPRHLAGGAVILVLYFGLQMLVPGAGLHRTPAYTAWFLLGLVTLALTVGFVWRDRAFCRGFCPVGLLLGTYGRGGMVAVRPAPHQPAGAPAGPDVRSCPSLLHPSRLSDNADCLVCTHCFKQAPAGSMRLLLRRPFSATDQRESLASWPVTGFVMVASGFVSSELCSEWAAAKKVYLAAPKWATAQAGWQAGAGWIEGVWTLLVVPGLIWLVLGGILRLAGEKAPLPELWRRIALPVAVVVAAGHLSKGLAKLISWVQFLPGAISDPAGRETARAITHHKVTAPAPVLSVQTASWAGVALVALALIVAVREYRLARPEAPGIQRGAWPLATLAGGYGFVIAGWN